MPNTAFTQAIIYKITGIIEYLCFLSNNAIYEQNFSFIRVNYTTLSING